MRRCNGCPRRCNAQRTESENIGGFCRMPSLPKIAKAGLHFWEEPFISGTSGSGTVFFSGCSLGCVFCQNDDISHRGFGKTVSVQRLADIFRELERQGAENINLVNPTHYFSAISDALAIYRPSIPVVFNSGGYDLPENIEKDLFDIYLFDIKYFSEETSGRYAAAADYFEYARRCVTAACKLIPQPVYAENGMMKRGVVVRHLILPRHTNEAISIIDWCRRNAPGAVLSVMSQYIPVAGAAKFPEINRRITEREYDKVVGYMLDSGIENAVVQERSSADKQYIPDFDLSGV